MVMETEIILFKRHAEMLGPDLLLPIQILFNIRLLLGKKKITQGDIFNLEKLSTLSTQTHFCVLL